VARSRGASYFSVDWQKLRGQLGFGRELRLCVATKKRLQLYEWKKSTFCQIKVSGWVGVAVGLIQQEEAFF
jgi:hypothetical protein